MFKITPIQNTELQKEYAAKCNTTYKEGMFAYSMCDANSGRLMGFSQFEITECGGCIADLCSAEDPIDYEAMFILGRATMNFIDLCGAHTAKAERDSADEKLLHAIGFKKLDDESYFCDMTGLFDGHCDGKDVDLNN